jgi:hypothetical protein
LWYFFLEGGIGVDRKNLKFVDLMGNGGKKTGNSRITTRILIALPPKSQQLFDHLKVKGIWMSLFIHLLSSVSSNKSPATTSAGIPQGAIGISLEPTRSGNRTR